MAVIPDDTKVSSSSSLPPLPQQLPADPLVQQHAHGADHPTTSTSTPNPTPSVAYAPPQPPTQPTTRMGHHHPSASQTGANSNAPRSLSFALCVFCDQIVVSPMVLTCGHLICARHLVQAAGSTSQTSAEPPAYEPPPAPEQPTSPSVSQALNSVSPNAPGKSLYDFFLPLRSYQSLVSLVNIGSEPQR